MFVPSKRRGEKSKHAISKLEMGFDNSKYKNAPSCGDILVALSVKPTMSANSIVVLS